MLNISSEQSGFFLNLFHSCWWFKWEYSLCLVIMYDAGCQLNRPIFNFNFYQEWAHLLHTFTFSFRPYNNVPSPALHHFKLSLTPTYFILLITCLWETDMLLPSGLNQSHQTPVYVRLLQRLSPWSTLISKLLQLSSWWLCIAQQD